MKQKPYQTEHILEKAGLKKTDARIALLDLLASNHHPVSIKTIATTLSKKGVDRVTVYRMIEALSKKGLIKRVTTGTREAQYEIIDMHEDHHHIICLQCKKVCDFTGCDADKVIAMALRQVKEFKTIQHHSFDLFGICTACSKK